MLLVSCFFETTNLAPVIDEQLLFLSFEILPSSDGYFFKDIILKLIKNWGGGGGRGKQDVKISQW